MAFWANRNLEPLRKFRFEIQFGNEMMWYAKSVTQPSAEVSTSEYQLINHKIKYPGIVTWNDVEIVLVDFKPDPGESSKGKKLRNQLAAWGYSPEGASDGIVKEQYSGKSYYVINKLDANGNIIETWELKNPFIKSIKYGDLDYSGDDLLEITITVAYDSATLT